MPTKRCPMCHRSSGVAEWQCTCGYEFGQDIDQVLARLRDRRTNARILLGLLIAIDLAALVAVVVLAARGILLYSGLGFGALLTATVRVARRLAITGESIRQLERRALPRATLRKG